MGAFFSLPEDCKIVEAIAPVVGTGASVGDYVSLKHCSRCYIYVHLTQANAATTAITIEKATDVAGTGSTAITVAVPIWANQDCAASDTLVAQTAAVSFTTSNTVKHKQFVFEIDPSTLGGSYDCICVKTGASNIANLICATYFLTDLDYHQATPPTAITD